VEATRSSRETWESMFATAAGLILFAAWLQSVYTGLETGSAGIALAGLLFPPFAILHGIGLWLGVW